MSAIAPLSANRDPRQLRHAVDRPPPWNSPQYYHLHRRKGISRRARAHCSNTAATPNPTGSPSRISPSLPRNRRIRPGRPPVRFARHTRCTGPRDRRLSSAASSFADRRSCDSTPPRGAVGVPPRRARHRRAPANAARVEQRPMSGPESASTPRCTRPPPTRPPDSSTGTHMWPQGQRVGSPVSALDKHRKTLLNQWCECSLPWTRCPRSRKYELAVVSWFRGRTSLSLRAR